MKGLLTLLSIILMLPAQAQNLVLDGSFEDTVFCPMWHTANTNLNLTHWKYTGLMSGFTFNTCNTGAQSIPQNAWGYEPAHSGNGYIGICTYKFYRPAIGHLSQTLEAGKRYRISLYVSLCDSVIFACNNFQVYFSDTIPVGFLPNGDPYLVFTHPVNANFHQDLKSKVGWTKLDTTFIATGNERWITLGNFLNDAQSDGYYVGGNLPVTCCSYTDQSGSFFMCRGWSSGGAGYYLDDVSVVLDDDTGLEGVGEAGVQVFPNPNQGAFTVALARPGMGVVEVFDLLGRQVFTAPLQGQGRQELHPNLAKGIYTCNVIQNGQVVLQTKLVVQ